MNTSTGLANVSDSPRQRFTVTWWMWLLIFIGLVFLGWVSWNLMMQSAINAELDRIRAEGYPATPAELDAWYAMPEGRNAADVYLEAISLHTRPSEDDEMMLPYVGSGERPDPMQPMSDELRTVVERYVTINADALTKIHEAVDISESRYPVQLMDGELGVLPALGSLRSLSGLCAVAVLHQSESGNIEGALNTIQSMAALARSLHNEPTLVSQLVQVALHGEVCLRIEWLVQRHALTEVQLSRLEQTLHVARSPDGLTRGFAGERGGFNAFLQRRQALVQVASDMGFQHHVYLGLGLGKRDHQKYLQLMRNYVEATQAEPATQMQRAVAIQQEYDEALPRYPILGRVLPAMSRVMEIHHRGLVRHHSTLLALAALRYQLATGDLPGSLDQLVPGYLDAVFIDTFTGRPLEYERVGDGGFIIFSPGEDVAVSASGAARHEFIRDLEGYLKFQYRVPGDHPTQVR